MIRSGRTHRGRGGLMLGMLVILCLLGLLVLVVLWMRAQTED